MCENVIFLYDIRKISMQVTPILYSATRSMYVSILWRYLDPQVVVTEVGLCHKEKTRHLLRDFRNGRVT
jgi:hypothetical protein